MEDPRIAEFLDKVLTRRSSPINPKHQYQKELEDIKCVIGSGPIDGLRILRYSRFGNNITQIAHAIFVAKLLDLKYIELHGFGDFFAVGAHRIESEIELRVNQSRDSGGALLLGRFFNGFIKDGLYGKIPTSEFSEIIRNSVTKLINPSKIDTNPENLIHVHIRGGDIFSKSDIVNPNYTQPPLSYYTYALSNVMDRNSLIIIVSEDNLNPCVEGLVDWLKGMGAAYKVQSSTETADIRCLLSAQTIIASYGTFVPMIALLSTSLREIFYFRETQRAESLCHAGVKVHLIQDICGDYIQQGEWRNTESQRNAMLEYPHKCLKYEKKIHTHLSQEGQA